MGETWTKRADCHLHHHLKDGSAWHVDDNDQIDSGLWLPLVGSASSIAPESHLAGVGVNPSR
jgi:hypothetical protein